MTIPTRFGMGAFPALLLALACGPNSADEIVSPQLNVADASSWPAASGHGNWINAAGEYVSRSFQGREMPDGSVEGNFVQHITAVNGDKRVNKGDIICLLVGPVEAIGLGANEAILSGPIHENINPDIIGWTQIFRVRDNGEGSDPPDAQSGLFFRSPESGLNCRNFVPPIVTPIESGNIQVKP